MALERNNKGNYYFNCFPFSYSAARYVGAMFLLLSVGKSQARPAAVGPLFENWLTAVELNRSLWTRP